MKYSCDIIKDLLPLYYDGACSTESKKTVEEHLAKCDSCRNLFNKMQDNTYDDCLQKERNEVMSHHAKNIKEKTLLAGLCVVSIPLLVCLIVNIITRGAADWFFIVLTATMTLVSLIGVPVFVKDRKFLWTLCSFTTSLILLLMVCSLYSNGDWFLVASVSVLLGLSIICLPIAIYQLPLKGFARQNKGLVVMLVDTSLLYALIIVCGLYNYSPSYWKPAILVTSATVLFVWFLFTIIRYLKSNRYIKSGICIIICGIFFSLIHDIIYWIMEGILYFSFMDANLTIWNTDEMINANCYLLILLFGCVLGCLLLLIGMIKQNNRQ